MPEPTSDDDQSTPAEPAPASEENKWRRPRGRNRASAPKQVFFVASVTLASLTLAGCAPQYWPANWTNTDVNPEGTPTSSIDAALLEEGAHPPALNQQQIGDVLESAAEVAKTADEKQDAKELEPRFTGDALTIRAARYAAHKADDSHPMPAEFPTGEIVYALPESSDQWPRTIFTVVAQEPKDGQAQAPYAIMLQQDQPRDNYKVASMTQLVANVSLPEAAPASIGSQSIRDLPGELVIAPDKLAAAYADVIANGDKSPEAAKFDPNNDTLRAQVNDKYRKDEASKLDPAVAKMDFSYKATDTKPLGMVGLKGDAIVAVSIQETERVTAANDRAIISLSGLTAKLAGIDTTSKGFERTYTDVLLFLVPAQADGAKVQFLGASQAMTGAKEL